MFLWSPEVALSAIGVHVLLDGLDGPLARELGVESPGGSFTDTAADQTVVTASMITLMWMRTADVLAGAVYIILYAVVVTFAMVRNVLAVPYGWIVRPRLLVYAWLAVELWLWPGSLDGVLWLCNVMLGLKCVTGFRANSQKPLSTGSHRRTTSDSGTPAAFVRTDLRFEGMTGRRYSADAVRSSSGQRKRSEFQS